MTARFELTTPAERDLEEIFFEVKGRHGQLIAERVYGNLLRTFELLAERLRSAVSVPSCGQRPIDSGPRVPPTSPIEATCDRSAP